MNVVKTILCIIYSSVCRLLHNEKMKNTFAFMSIFRYIFVNVQYALFKIHLYANIIICVEWKKKNLSLFSKRENEFFNLNAAFLHIYFLLKYRLYKKMYICLNILYTLLNIVLVKTQRNEPAL